MILLSTDSEVDLTKFNSKSVEFDSELPPLVEINELKYKNRWLLGSRDGCSCGFRHLHTSAVELGFDVPQDWYEEAPEDIESTLEFAEVVLGLVQTGAKVDCIDVWEHATSESTTEDILPVAISSMPKQNFRFMECRHFVFE